MSPGWVSRSRFPRVLDAGYRPAGRVREMVAEHFSLEVSIARLWGVVDAARRPAGPAAALRKAGALAPAGPGP